MTELNLMFDCERAMRDLANYSVGFLTISLHPGKEGVSPLGSGTLVKIGFVHGVLTAAHVLDALPDRGEVALVRFPNKPELLQSQRIDMAIADKVIVAWERENPDGPDLGFLRLPPLNVANLKGTNSFKPLSRETGAADRPKGAASIDVVIGVVGE